MKSKLADFQKKTVAQMEEKDEAWFLSQIESRFAEIATKGNFFEVLCPFHPDTSLGSFGIHRYLGFYKCFACGAKGPWNRLADHVGMEKIKRIGEDNTVGSESVQEVKDTMARALRAAGVEDPSKHKDKLRPMVEPWRKEDGWRNVSGALLSRIGCVRVVDLKHNVLRIGLPVRNIDQQLLGYTCRALDPEDAEPKYAPMAADRTSWRRKELPAADALFLIDQAMLHDWEYVVIVEGPYDALHLLALGVNAVAILGTNNWTPQKVATLSGLFDLRGAVVLMDNDDSGREAQAQIVRDLSSSMKCTGLKLPPSIKDPGGMSQKQADWVKNKALQLI